MPNTMWRTMMALPSAGKKTVVKKSNEPWQRSRQHSIELNKIGFNFKDNFDGTYSIYKWLKTGEYKTNFEPVHFKNLTIAEKWIKENYENLKSL